MREHEPTPAVQVLGVDHLEWWVADAEAVAWQLCARFGFRPLGRARDGGVHRYLIGQGGVRFVLTSSTDRGSEVHAQVTRHGDSIRDVAFRVADPPAAFAAAVRAGARPVSEPSCTRDAHGEVTRATLAAHGNTVHTLISRERYAGLLAPGFEPWAPDALASVAPDVTMLGIDHVNTALPHGSTDEWIDFYQRVFGMSERQRFDADVLSTDRSALSSRLLQDPAGHVLLPSAEPVPGRTGHIDRGIAAHGGAYFQHVAIHCADLPGTVRTLRARGAGFMQIPQAYYRDLPQRVHLDPDALAEVDELRILVDEDDDGLLLQIFSEHIGPEVWLEYIERRGSRTTLGERNIQALALAAELHEQDEEPLRAAR